VWLFPRLTRTKLTGVCALMITRTHKCPRESTCEKCSPGSCFRRYSLIFWVLKSRESVIFSTQLCVFISRIYYQMAYLKIIAPKIINSDQAWPLTVLAWPITMGSTVPSSRWCVNFLCDLHAFSSLFGVWWFLFVSKSNIWTRYCSQRS